MVKHFWRDVFRTVKLYIPTVNIRWLVFLCQKLLQDREKATRKAHNLEIGGSNPSPAILQRNRFATEKHKP